MDKLVSFLVLIYNAIFRVERLSAMNHCKRGVNLYVFEGAPTADPEVYRVKFSHVLNGVEENFSITPMTKKEWFSLRDRFQPLVQNQEGSGVAS